MSTDTPHADFRDLGYIDHISQARPGIKVYPGRLHAVTAISNPVRYRSRYELYRRFAKHMADSGVQLFTVEVAHGNREFEITETGNPWHLQLRSHYLQEIWLKENMLNIGINRLFHMVPHLDKAAWIDADIVFSRPDFAQETLHQLDHYEVVQMFTHAYDLDENFKSCESHQSFGYSYAMGEPKPVGTCGDYPGSGVRGAWWHPGYAWAARKSFFQKTGGLFDQSGLGAGDMMMACAIIGDVARSYNGNVSEGLKRQCKIYEERCQALDRNLGYVPGTIYHYFHGRKRDRGYESRWKYLTDGQEAGLGASVIADILKFNPETDLIRDHQGLYQLPHNKIRLRDGFRAYMRSRKEDEAIF